MPPPIRPSISCSATQRALERAFDAQDASRTAELILSLARAGNSQVMRAFNRHPLQDDWTDFAYGSLSAYFERARGYLYCVTNPTVPDFHKVGKTGRTPQERLVELNNEAVVGAFVLIKSWPVYDRHGLERLAHRALAQLPSHKEFFHGPWRVVLERVDAAVAADLELLEQAGIPLPQLAI